MVKKRNNLNRRTLNKRSSSEDKIKVYNKRRFGLFCCGTTIFVILLCVLISHAFTGTPPSETQLTINCSGTWNGSYSTGEGFQLINGTGEKTINVSTKQVPMAAFIQKDSGKDKLTVYIIKNGEIITKNSTRERNKPILITG